MVARQKRFLYNILIIVTSVSLWRFVILQSNGKPAQSVSLGISKLHFCWVVLVVVVAVDI
jgi:hypothetical protein